MNPENLGFMSDEWMTGAQKKAYKYIQSNDYRILKIQKGRQLGVTTMLLKYAFESALMGKEILFGFATNENRKYWRQRASQHYLCQSPSNTNHVVHFPSSDGIIRFVKMDPSITRGVTVDIVILDEFEWMNYPDECFKSAWPAFKERIILASLPNINTNTVFRQKQSDARRIIMSHDKIYPDSNQSYKEYLFANKSVSEAIAEYYGKYY